MVSEADKDAPLTRDRDEPRRASDRSKKSKRPKPPPPSSEAEIDAPDRLTLLTLGVMGILTLVLWGFARGGCNYHPPRETRRPRAVKLEELARDPKDAALEMQQRLLQLDFDGALELASADAAREVTKAKADCTAKAQDCAMQKKQAEKSVHSTSALLERQMSSALARVTSETSSGKQVMILKLERTGGIWKVVSRAKDDGSWRPPPPEFMPQMPPEQLGTAPAVPTGSVRAIPFTVGSAGPGSHTLIVRPPGAATPAPAGSK